MKIRIFLMLFLLIPFLGVSQNNQKSSMDGMTSPSDFKYDMSWSNAAQSALNFPFADNNQNNFGTLSVMEDENPVQPLASIEVGQWGTLKNIEEGGLVYFSSQLQGLTFSVKTYDNDLSEDSSFSIEIPQSANQVRVLNHYSTGFFNSDDTEEFLIYLHYFANNEIAPENIVSEVWVVDSEGELLNQLPGVAAWGKYDDQGNKLLFTYLDDEENVAVKSYNPEDFTEINSLELPSYLINYFVGVPFDFMDLDGEEYIVLAHYESLFMDNATLEVTPDNHLIVKLLDFQLQEVQQFQLDIQKSYEDLDQFVIPMAGFGTIYKDNSYNITQNVFDQSGQRLVLYEVRYYDMIQDVEWMTLRIGDEEGNIIKQLDKYIIDIDSDLQEIEGQDNQMGLFIGEGEDATSIEFFNLESWETVAVFEAEHNGQLLSSSFNRVAHEDSYHYIFAMGLPLEEEGVYYGLVNQYSIDGELYHSQKLAISPSTNLFNVYMASALFEPNLFSETHDALHYMYLYLEENQGIHTYNLVVARDETDILAEFRGDTEKGDISGAGLAMHTNGNRFDKLVVQYAPNSAQLSLTEFYGLPLEESGMGIDQPEQIQIKVYPNPATDRLYITSGWEIEQIEVYDLTGRKLIHQRLNQNLNFGTPFVELNHLSKGVYFAHISLADGLMEKIKFIKR